MGFIFQWIKDLQEFYSWADSISDARTAKWLFVPSIFSPVAFVVTYLFLIWMLPRVMKNKEPFQLTSLLLIYNAAMVLLNFYITIEAFLSSAAAGYSYSCQKFSMSFNPRELRVTSVLWWFYFSKFVELLDTIFFLLRKKNNQVSFLHVYHHTSMVCLWWIGIKWVPNGQAFFQCHGQCYGACHYVHLLWIVSSAIFEEVPLVEETPNTDSNGPVFASFNSCLGLSLCRV